MILIPIALSVIAQLSYAGPTSPDLDNAAFTAIEIINSSKDQDSRWRAVRILGSLRYRKATPFLIKLLGDPNDFVRANAARGLADMKAAEARAPLVALIARETDGGVIQQTTLGLQALGAKEALPALRKLVAHKDPQTRSWVIQTIGILGSKSDVPLIANSLDDSNPSTAMMAAEQLQTLTGANFGFPPHQGPQGFEPLQKAKEWWTAHKDGYK